MNGWNLKSNNKINHDGPHDVTMKALNSTMLRVSSILTHLSYYSPLQFLEVQGLLGFACVMSSAISMPLHKYTAMSLQLFDVQKIQFARKPT